MATPEEIGASLLERHLAAAQLRAEAGNYDGALSAVREAKALEPKNVYVLAFEKQAEQLGELDASNTLTDDQRTDILESMPAIIERALESSRSPGTLTDLSAIRPGPDVSQQKKEKAAALEWLKNQYFQHAHEYVRKGEYQHALAEIRRVYIIDSGNKVAKDFERQIDQLAQLKSQQSTRIHPAIIATSQPAPPPAVTPVKPVLPAKPVPEGQESEPTPMLTDEFSSPQHIVRSTRAPAVETVKEKGNKLLLVLILLALLVLGAAVLWYFQRTTVGRKPAQRTALPPASTEQFVGAPSQAAEQDYLVSNADSSSGTPVVTELPQSEEPPATKEPVSTTPAKRGGAKSEAAKRSSAGGERKPNPAKRVTTPQSTPTDRLTASNRKREDTTAPAPFVPVEREARIIRLERPKFSSILVQKGIEGQVVIQVQIDPSGKPIQTVTLKSTNDLLIQPIIDAVMSSEFSPAEMSTGPVTSWLTIPFKFASR